MPSVAHPEVFVSATSDDLGTCRRNVKEALLTLGCMPVEQANFPPDARRVEDMLRARIEACDAVVHIAGELYGKEPSRGDGRARRRSYAQMEYEVARALGKPTYVFVCGSAFPYDAHAPEDEERRRLQEGHRARLTSADHVYTRVESREDLSARVHALQLRVEQLTRDLDHSRSRLALGVGAGLLLLVGLGGGVWWVGGRASRTEEHVARLEGELARQRRYLREVVDAALPPPPPLARADARASSIGTVVGSLVEVQSPPEAASLRDAQVYDRALDAAAEREGISSAEMRAQIALFAAAVRRAGPDADPEDQTLVLWSRAQAAVGTERVRLLGAAIAAFRSLLDVRTLRTAPEEWAKYQDNLGTALVYRAMVAGGTESARWLGEAVAAYRAALKVRTREALPQAWARTQSNLGNALQRQAEAADAADIAPLLGEAVAAYRSALEVYTREDLPHEWARTQDNLATALAHQAPLAAGRAEHVRLLGEAVAAYRAALEVRTHQTVPRDWASTQNNMANVLVSQARATGGAEGARLLAEAVVAFRATLEVSTREALPREWALTQNNLGIALRREAETKQGAERARLLGEAVAAYRLALEVRTRAATPQDWAATQNNIAVALRSQAEATEGPERARLLGEAVAACRAAFEVYTPATLPQDWAMVQKNLAKTLGAQADATEGTDRARLLGEAAAAWRAMLDVYTREAWPQDWAATEGNLALTLRAAADEVEGPDRVRLLTQAVDAMRSAMEVLAVDMASGESAKWTAWIAEAEARAAESRPR